MVQMGTPGMCRDLSVRGGSPLTARPVCPHQREQRHIPWGDCRRCWAVPKPAIAQHGLVSCTTIHMEPSTWYLTCTYREPIIEAGRFPHRVADAEGDVCATWRVRAASAPWLAARRPHHCRPDRRLSPATGAGGGGRRHHRSSARRSRSASGAGRALRDRRDTCGRLRTCDSRFTRYTRQPAQRITCPCEGRGARACSDRQDAPSGCLPARSPPACDPLAHGTLLSLPRS
jgi:hypothetical protein